MAYLIALPMVILWAMLRGYQTGRSELTRCAAVIAGHAVLLQTAAGLYPVIEGHGYPFGFITASLVGVLWLVCQRPAGRPSAVLAGSVLFGIIASLLYGVSTTWNGPSVYADWNMFTAQFTMGWANIIILLGWTHERSLGRIASRCGSAVVSLVRFAHIGGVAR